MAEVGQEPGALLVILLGPEARGDMATVPAFGHQRDPMLFTCNVLRAFNVTSYDGTTNSDGYVNLYVTPLGMDLFPAPTVFSYYPPNFNTPGYAPLLGPEFAILDTIPPVFPLIGNFTPSTAPYLGFLGS
jgi:hypothetical protein